MVIKKKNLCVCSSPPPPPPLMRSTGLVEIGSVTLDTCNNFSYLYIDI